MKDEILQTMRNFHPRESCMAAGREFRPMPLIEGGFCFAALMETVDRKSWLTCERFFYVKKRLVLVSARPKILNSGPGSGSCLPVSKLGSQPGQLLPTKIPLGMKSL